MVAWLLGVAFIAIAGTGVYLQLTGTDERLPLSFAVVASAFHGVAVLLVWKRPDNRVGWILAALGLSQAVSVLQTGYFAGGAHAPPASAVELALAVVGHKQWILNFGIIATIFYLLPTGILHSRRWRWPFRITVTGFALVALFTIFEIGPLDTESPLSPDNPLNPVGLEGMPGDVLRALGVVGFPMLFVGLVGAPISLIFRYRSAGLMERAQLKWVTAGAAAAGLALAANAVGRGSRLLPIEASEVITTVAVTIVPVAMAFSILRYRLFDIDRIISRTVAYVLISLSLGGIFALVVLVPSVLIGVSSPPAYVVSAATIVVAALFQPVRRRVQDAVDHRFNRRRYDAERTIAAFTARLREQVDIDALQTEFLDVVTRTMYPSHTSLWVKR